LYLVHKARRHRCELLDISATNVCTLFDMRRVVVPLCECQGSLMDPDQLEAAERRRCLDCGQPAPPSKWRCLDCQATVHDRARKMRAALEAGRRETSHVVHLPGTSN
jgi:hypothetical protein